MGPPQRVVAAGQDRGVSEIPGWLSSTLAADAADGRGALPPWIHALSPAATIAGPALVMAMARDDNKAIRDVAAAVRQPGTVLVAAGGAESRTALIGDLIARELLAVGVVAIVTDGLIRDSREVADVGLPVWARGVTPVASAKNGPGHIGGSVTIGGGVVYDGDLVIADADGAVIWPAADLGELIAAADARRRSDDERLARLTAANPKDTA
jgi:4-hydroxy-4-methyl-2-oxoglutarate aldolase